MKTIANGLLLCAICLLFSVSLLQAQDLKILVHKTDSLLARGLLLNADTTNRLVYKLAKQQQNHDVYVHSLVQHYAIHSRKSEDPIIDHIKMLLREADSASLPSKSILHVYIGNLFVDYLNQNSYRIAQRSQTTNFDLEDIQTYTFFDLSKAALAHFRMGIAQPQALAEHKLDNFNFLLGYHLRVQSPYVNRAMRPSLLHLMAYSIIEVLPTLTAYIPKNDKSFAMTNPAFLANTKDFANCLIQPIDTLSAEYFSLNLFQTLVNIHLKDNNLTALLDAELARINYTYRNINSENKKSLYINALSYLVQTYPNNEQVTRAIYALAEFYASEASTYNRGQNPDKRFFYNKSLELCRTAIEKFPNSYGAEMTKKLQSDIKAPHLHLKIEQSLPQNSNSLFAITYKNVQRAFFRVIKLTNKEYQDFCNYQYNEKKFHVMNRLLQKEQTLAFSLQMPNDSADCQLHLVNYYLKPLNLGNYILLASPDSNFHQKKWSESSLVHTSFRITNFAIAHLKDEWNKETTLFVLNNKTGEPISGAKVKYIASRYDYNSGKRQTITLYETVSDTTGFVTLKIDASKLTANTWEYSYGVECSKDNEESTTVLSSYNFSFDKNREASRAIIAHNYTDRTLYRPNQKVYFKTIVLASDGKNAEVIANKEIIVTFTDPNGQIIETKSGTTNAFGSFAAEFTTPTGGLLGRMTLSVGFKDSPDFYTTTSINVEEYKRPLFEVNFDPVKANFKLNESLEVSAKAKAFSGASIDNAAVKYSVVRTLSVSGWWPYWRRVPTSTETILKSGTGTTDAEGNFMINFNATPDPSVALSQGVTFNYRIEINVTDLNGETQSSKTNIRVGVTALELSTNLELQHKKAEEPTTVNIFAKNLSGQPQEARVAVLVTKLKAPETLLLPSKFEVPDLFILKEQEFKSLFPYEVYKEEDKFYTWPTESTIFQNEYSVPNQNEFALDFPSAGVYSVSLKAKDAYGQDVQSIQYVIVLDSKQPFKQPVLTQNNQEVYSVNDKASIKISTGFDKQRIFFTLFRDKQKLESKWLYLNNNMVSINHTMTEEDRGGLYYSVLAFRENRFFIEEGYLNLPFSNKDLDVNFETFRDKLQPGQEEEWRILVKGADNEKVAAELVATLYDASLDKIGTPNSFEFAPFTMNANYANFEVLSVGITTSSSRLKLSSYYPKLSIAYEELGFISDTYYYDGYYLEDEEKTSTSVNRRMNNIGFTKSKGFSGGSNKKAKMREKTSEQAFGYSEDSAAMPIMESPSATMLDENLAQPFETDKVPIRTNFNETAIFVPQLQTNADGSLTIKFRMPESLTKWKLLGLAHTKKAEFALFEKALRTQKELMIVPNAPRFFRENDRIVFTAKVTNLSAEEALGQVSLEFYNTLTNEKITDQLLISKGLQEFRAASGQSAQVSWELSIPDSKFQAVSYRIVAVSNKFSDGEEKPIQVLTNRMLVTESLPIAVSGASKESYYFNKLAKNQSKSLVHHSLTLEFTSNPAWYAVQSLPYLMEYPYECAEQTFSRYYANALAAHIMNASPKIKEIFDQWKNTNAQELVSKLESNPELKLALLEETPWVLQAKNETDRKKNLAVLFDLNRIAKEQNASLNKLKAMQYANGGFPWFNKMPASSNITMHLAKGFAHLINLGVIDLQRSEMMMFKEAVRYLDNNITDYYKDLLRLSKDKKINLNDKHINYFVVQYLYLRANVEAVNLSKIETEAISYFTSQLSKYWLSMSLSEQAMAAIVFTKRNMASESNKVFDALRQRSLYNPEMGRYWKEMTVSSYLWNEAPIETMALMIEAFTLTGKDDKVLSEMQSWLLKNKQTNNWQTTKATTEAVYALFLQSASSTESSKPKLSFDLLEEDPNLTITLGNEKVDMSQKEAGTGYFKKTFKASEFNESSAKVEVNKPSKGVAWGALYWQYFEQLDKITTSKTPLSISKKLFVERESSLGKVIVPIEKETLKVGDFITVRVELTVDREMDYVHLKDMRASCLEPTTTISTYKYQDGLGYYESMRDASANFFFEHLYKGKYVFEYKLKVTHAGNFSNGITSIQCMYAPEFSSNSEGIRIVVK